MLGSEDLLQIPTRTFNSSPQSNYQNETFDYDNIRAEIEETRALKSDADSLISKYIKASERVRSEMNKAKRKQQGQFQSVSQVNNSRQRHQQGQTRNAHINSGTTGARYYDGGGNTIKTRNTNRGRGAGERNKDGGRRKKGVVMAKTIRKNTTRKSRKKIVSSTTKLRKKAAINSSRQSNKSPNATSPGTADRIFVSKRSSIRPSELDDIRTYPKKEVQIIRRSRKTKPKVGPTEIYDQRSKVKEARFVKDNVPQNDDESRGLLRDSEKLLGLSSISQKLTILADTSNNYEDGPSPRFLRPQPTAQSFSPDVLHQQQQQQQQYNSQLNPSATILQAQNSRTQQPSPSSQPQIIYQQVQQQAHSPSPPQQPSIDPEFVRITNEKLAQAEEMVRKLSTQTSLLETTNAALKSQLLSQESRVLEIERRERYELERKQKIEQEKRLKEEEAKFAKARLEDAEKAKDDAISIVKTLESANKNLQKGCEALQDQVIEHQKRADRADMISVKLREASYQQQQKLIGQQASVVATRMAHDLGAVDNFDDLCEVLVTELLMEELGLKSKNNSNVVNNDNNNNNNEVKPSAKFVAPSQPPYKRKEHPITQPLEEVESADEIDSDANTNDAADDKMEEDYDDDDFDDEEEEITKSAPPPRNNDNNNAAPFSNEMFTTRLHMEINKLRDDLAKDVELRQTIAEERYRREGMENRMKVMAEKEALVERAAKAEAELKQAAEREKYLEKLHLSMQQELSLQQKLETAEANAQFMERQMKKKEEEERALKERLALEGERADSFALAATRVVAQQPLVDTSAIIPPPTSPNQKQTNVVEEKKTDANDNDDDIDFIDEEEEQPRAYTILYARPNDDVLYTKYGESSDYDLNATGNDDDSHYNSLLSDHSYANLTNASNYTSEESSILENTYGTEMSDISGADSLLDESDTTNKIDESSASEIDIDALASKFNLVDQQDHLKVQPVSSTQKMEINNLLSRAVTRKNVVTNVVNGL